MLKAPRNRAPPQHPDLRRQGPLQWRVQLLRPSRRMCRLNGLQRPRRQRPKRRRFTLRRHGLKPLDPKLPAPQLTKKRKKKSLKRAEAICKADLRVGFFFSEGVNSMLPSGRDPTIGSKL